MDLSVVIPVHNGAATLPQQLDALLGQSWGRSWEIVVVDNCSTDGIAAVIDRFSNRPVPVRLVVAGDRASIGYARNSGVAAAHGAAIAMCDADDVVSGGWVAAMGDALLEHEFVTGPIEVFRLNPQWVVDTRGHALEDGPGDFLHAFHFAHSCNLGFQRLVFERVGGFDESLVNGSDVEFSYRLWKAGIALHYVEPALVHYRYRDTIRGLARQARSYARNKHVLAERFRVDGTELKVPSDLRYLVWLLRNIMLIRSSAGRARLTWIAATFVGGIEGAFKVWWGRRRKA
jgi:glycosyltransferase involved in cell wall biosynthesis